jgi:dolichol-phosphate mannosyltransferase
LKSLPPIPPGQYRVGVVLPVYSETDSVREVVADLTRILGERLEEILVVISPRSGEESRGVCEDLARADPRVRVHVQVENPGLGRAVREGYERVRGNLVLNMDSDGEMESDTVRRMVEEMESGGYDLVLASRWARGGGFRGYSRAKLVLNWGFQQLFRLLYRTRLSDLTYGYKLMRAEIARGIRWEGTLHEIACETSLAPLREGFRASQVPTVWTVRAQGVTKNKFSRNFRYVSTAVRILRHGARWRGGGVAGDGED